MSKEGRVDLGLVIPLALLLAIGTIVVYSSSSPLTQQERFGYDSTYFLRRHIFKLFIGLCALMLTLKLDYHWFRKLTLLFLLVTFILLALIIILKGGRWFRVGPISFQPSELAKFSIVIYLADFLERKRELIGKFRRGILPPLLVVGTTFVFVAIEPDFSTAFVILSLAGIMLFLGGARLRHLLTIGLSSLPLLFYFIQKADYRTARIWAFLHPLEDTRKLGYQLHQSLISLGSGGLLGTGIGEGRAKLFFLPQPHTDLILSSIGEEMGFLGIVTVFLLFFLFLLRGVRASVRAPDLYGSFLGLGLLGMIGLGFILNVGVACGRLPTTGLPLPFISYGGSSLLFCLMGSGIILQLSNRGRRGRFPRFDRE